MRPRGSSVCAALLLLVAPAATAARAAAPGAPSAVSRRAQAYHLFLLGQESLAERDYARAVTLLERAAALDDSPDLLLELARLRVSLNELDEAYALAQRVASVDPGSAAAHKLMGDVYLARARAGTDSETSIAQAIDEYRAALLADPADDESSRTLAELYYHTGRMKEAGDLLAGLARSRALDPALSLLFGKVLIRDGRYDEAEAILTRIVARSSSNLEAADALAVLYELKKDYGKAIAVYAPFLDQGLQQGYLHDRIGSLHLLAGHYQEAIRELLEGQKAQEGDSRGLLALAQAYEGAGQFDDAAGCYDRLIAREPANLEARFQKARLLERQGESEAALAGYGALADLAAGRGAVTEREAVVLALAYSRIGLIQMEARNYAAAADAFVKALNSAQEPGPELFLLLGRVNLQAHRPEVAERAALEGTRRHPTDLPLRVLRGEVLIEKGDERGAREFFSELLGEREHAPEAYEQIAEALLRQKRFDDADTLLKEGTRRHPEDDSLLFTRGATLEHLGRIAEAEKFLSKAIGLNPKNAMALNYLGYMLADRGLKLRESIAYVKRALELDPKNAAYLDSLGWAQFKLAQFEPAEQNLRSALSFDRADPTIRDHLGDLLAATGRMEEALQEWGQALHHGHEEPERVREKIEKVRASLKASK